jgi:GTP diphosphokinase / guanosine-3',5'-bis(diphosphate) 3'-diphosphatase
MSTIFKMSKETETGTEILELQKIVAARAFARAAHENQVRDSGEDYFEYHIEPVVKILVYDFGINDTEIIAAAYLHDVLEDSNLELGKIRDKCGERVANKVKSVTKLKPKDDDGNLLDKEVISKRYFKQLIKEGELDVGILLIKLADNLHNARTYEHLDEEKRIRKAKESYYYAQIAEGLGMWTVMNELKDRAFYHGSSEAYKQMKSLIENDPRNTNNEYEKVKSEVGEILHKNGISAKIDLRKNSVKTIADKLIRARMLHGTQKNALSYINDVQSVRVVVNSVPECFSALGIIHTLYADIIDENRFDEFLTKPRVNGYSAIQTTINTKSGSIENAITTPDREKFNRDGILTHIRAGQSKDKTLLPKFIFAPGDELVITDRDATLLDVLYKMDPAIAANTVAVEIDNEITEDLSFNIKSGVTIKPILSNTPRLAPDEDLMEVVNQQSKFLMQQQIENKYEQELTEEGWRQFQNLCIPRGMTELTDNSEYEQEIKREFVVADLKVLYKKFALGLVTPEAINKAFDKIGFVKQRDETTFENSTLVLEGNDEIGVLGSVAAQIANYGGDVVLNRAHVEGNKYTMHFYIKGMPIKGARKLKSKLSKSKYNFDSITIV